MLKTSSFNPYFNVGLHLLGWSLLGFLLLFYVPLTWNLNIPPLFWIWQTLVLVMMLIVFYVNAKLVVPETIIKGKSGLFALWTLAVILGIQLLAYIYVASTGLHKDLAAAFGSKIKRHQLFDTFVFAITLLVLGISTSWAMLQHWQQGARHRQQLEQDKTVAELAMLKSQINPHFFFNSLNSVYSLTYINVEDSRTALHTLSRMMRYLLYSTGGEGTTLLKEIDFLKDYVSLMRLRTNDKLSIVTDIPDTLTDYSITPMLLLPFVENAFKHGVDATAKSEIRISVKQEADKLELSVVNGIFVNSSDATDEGGIGLVNTQRRLQLIYPQSHTLSAGVNQQGQYEVNLQIHLRP